MRELARAPRNQTSTPLPRLPSHSTAGCNSVHDLPNITENIGDVHNYEMASKNAYIVVEVDFIPTAVDCIT